MAEQAGVAAPTEPEADDWEYPAREGGLRAPRADATPLLSVEGFEGPLDFLLEMVRRHRVDLGQLAILPLIDQFVAGFAAAREHVPLERRGDWLVMASTLLQLKAQLLWPATAEAAEQAEADAARRLGALDDLAFLRAAAAWLAARPQLGIDVFARGGNAPPPSPQAKLYVAFLEATLVMLEGREGQGWEPSIPYRPPVAALWRVQDAIAWMRRMLAEDGTPRPLTAFLPGIPDDAPARELRCRAALASTFVAALELERGGNLAMQQHGIFQTICFRRADAVSSET